MLNLIYRTLLPGAISQSNILFLHVVFELIIESDLPHLSLLLIKEPLSVVVLI